MTVALFADRARHAEQSRLKRSARRLPGAEALEPYAMTGISCRTGFSCTRILAVRTASPLRTEPWKPRPARARDRELSLQAEVSGQDLRVSGLMQHLVQSVPVPRGLTDSHNRRWCHLEGAILLMGAMLVGLRAVDSMGCKNNCVLQHHPRTTRACLAMSMLPAEQWLNRDMRYRAISRMNTELRSMSQARWMRDSRVSVAASRVSCSAGLALLFSDPGNPVFERHGSEEPRKCACFEYAHGQVPVSIK